ncbi:MAG TPA: hypothetical protein VGD42_05730 [Lysobacter sp.]
MNVTEVRTPGHPDRLHDLNLLRMMQLANERTVRESGPLPPGGLPVIPKQKSPHLPAAWRTEFAAVKNCESEDEAMKQAVAVMALTTAGALAACTAGYSTQERSSVSASVQPESASAASTARPAESTGVAEIKASANSADERCADGRLLFHCATENGKEILLCDQGDSIGYSFGKPGETPELALSVPRNEATTFQWKGIGRWINYSVSVPSGSTKYTVYTSVDRVGDEHEFEAGVMVATNEEEVARIRCKEPVVHGLEGVDLKQDE